MHIAPAAVAGKVIVADIDAQKRAHARQMGAVATIDNAAPDAVKQVMEATGGGAAAAIDFVGSPKTMEFGVNILRKGGKLVMVGLYGGAHPISTVLFPFKMMTIEGSYVGTLDDLRELLALGEAGKVPPIPIETRPADQASAALSDLKSGGKVRGRVVLQHHHTPLTARGIARGPEPEQKILGGTQRPIALDLFASVYCWVTEGFDSAEGDEGARPLRAGFGPVAEARGNDSPYWAAGIFHVPTTM